MTKSPKPINLDLFEYMTDRLIAEARQIGLPNARIRDLQETKVVVRALRKARDKT